MLIVLNGLILSCCLSMCQRLNETIDANITSHYFFLCSWSSVFEANIICLSLRLGEKDFCANKQRRTDSEGDPPSCWGINIFVMAMAMVLTTAAAMAMVVLVLMVQESFPGPAVKCTLPHFSSTQLPQVKHFFIIIVILTIIIIFFSTQLPQVKHFR